MSLSIETINFDIYTIMGKDITPTPFALINLKFKLLC